MAITEPASRIRPITPAAAKAARVKAIPEEVIDVVNTLIVNNLKQNGQTQIYARVLQKDVSVEILSNASLRSKLAQEYPGIDANSALIKSGWLDFESVYQDNGWNSVTYSKPSFDESYSAFYEFTANQ